jgi:hypothetical protein
MRRRGPAICISQADCVQPLGPVGPVGYLSSHVWSRCFPPMSARSNWSSRSRRIGPPRTFRRVGTSRRLTPSRSSATMSKPVNAASTCCAGGWCRTGPWGTVSLTCAEQKRARRRVRDHPAATASRHWFAASARKIRSVEREMRWRWRLKVLWTAACVLRKRWAERADLNRCNLRSRRRTALGHPLHPWLVADCRARVEENRPDVSISHTNSRRFSGSVFIDCRSDRYLY